MKKQYTVGKFHTLTHLHSHSLNYMIKQYTVGKFHTLSHLHSHTHIPTYIHTHTHTHTHIFIHSVALLCTYCLQKYSLKIKIVEKKN